MAKRPRRILRRRWATTEGWRGTRAGMWAWLVQRGGAAPGDRAAPAQPVHPAGAGDPARPAAAARPARRARDPARLRPAGAMASEPAGAGPRGGRRHLRRVLGVAMVLKVFRWTPGLRERIQRFWVPAREGMTVLDALIDAQRRLDPPLAFRYACRVGMCGSCAMVVNGRERWACRTLLKSLRTGIVTVRPLYHFPLIRDLVVDMAPLAEQSARVGGAFVPREATPTAARIPAGAPERARIDPATERIGRGLCMSACTMVAN